MFKNMGELASALEKDRQFEDQFGWILKFDPLGKMNANSPFICQNPDTGEWIAMKMSWEKYAKVKEIFPDLEAIRSCVVNYLSGKEGIKDKVAKKILAMDSDSFWIVPADGKLIRGFNPSGRLGMKIDKFRIEKHGDIFLVVE